MKNQLAFIPDNISAISGASGHLNPTSRHEVNSDATDYFIDEILKQRTEKMPKEKERVDQIGVAGPGGRDRQDLKQSGEINPVSEFRMKQSLKGSRDRQSKFEMLMYLNESIAEKPQLSELNDSGRKSEVSQSAQKNVEKEQNKQPMIEDKLQTLANQSNQDYIIEKELHQLSNRMTEKGLNEHSQHKFDLPKVDRIENNQSNHISREHSNSIDERILKPQTSVSSQENKMEQISNSMVRGSKPSDKNQFSQVKEGSKKLDQLKKSYSHLDKNEKSRSSGQNRSSKNYNVNQQIQKLGQKEPSFGSMLETPVKALQVPRGFYELVENNDYYEGGQSGQKDYRDIAKAITDTLNQKQDSSHKSKGSNELNSPTLSKNTSKNNIPKQISSINKQPSQKSRPSVQTVQKKGSESEKKEQSKYESYEDDDLDTQISQISRDFKILEHRYESNLAFLTAQTQQLQSYTYFMLLDEENMQMRKKITLMDIQNKKQKIQLRSGSYSKRFNFINSMPIKNDHPLEYIPKNPVSEEVIAYCDELKSKIQDEKKVHIDNEGRLALLTKYYEIMKSRVISDNQEIQTFYQYDSKIGSFSPLKRRNLDDSQCSIANYFQTPKKRLMKSKSQTGFIKTKTSLGVDKTEKKKEKRIQRTPLTVYNLMKYKRDISKDVLLQFQVYNLGRMKRIRDETRLLQKQMEFVDGQIDHFDRSFAEEMKKFQEWAKPKNISYETFKVEQKMGPFTKSPFSRDYHANSKGMNNINIFRPDSTYQSSKQKDKSLSRSKYTISRASVHDLTLSKKQLAVKNDYKSEDNQKESSQFFRRKNNGAVNSEYGLDTFGVQKCEKADNMKRKSALVLLNRSPSKKSVSFRETSLTKFKTEPCIQEEQESVTSPIKRIKLKSPVRRLSPSRKSKGSTNTLDI